MKIFEQANINKLYLRAEIDPRIHTFLIDKWKYVIMLYIDVNFLVHLKSKIMSASDRQISLLTFLRVTH